MLLQNVFPSKFNFVSILQEFTSKSDLCAARRVHSCLRHSDFRSDVVVGTALLTLYGKCGSLEDAVRMFNSMPERNVVSWNSMIAIYNRHGQGKWAFHLFHQMLCEGVIANRITFISALSTCSSRRSLAEGILLHSFIVGSGLESDVIVGNALLNMYGKCDRLEDACRLFDHMPLRSVVSWTAMIAVFVQHGQVKNALHAFKKMQQASVMPNKVTLVTLLSACADPEFLAEGKQMHKWIMFCGFDSDNIVANALILMYGKSGSLEDVHRIFCKSKDHDVVSWTTVIAANIQQGQCEVALQFFHQMQTEGVLPDKLTFMSILDACSNPEALGRGKQIHVRMVGSEFELDVVFGTALINIYGKCGSMEYAWLIFNKMHVLNLVTWNTMIAVLSQQGQGTEALQLFHQMQHKGLIPDKATFVSSLDACANQATLFRGKQIHAQIVYSGFGSDLVVATALINMYGKTGNMEEASWIFNEYSEWDRVMWNSMISNLSQHGQGREALQLFQCMQLKGLIPDEVTFVSTLSACSHSGLVVEGWDIFLLMHREFGIQPEMEHYNCMIDLLGRAGCMNEGEAVLKCMPFLPNARSWTTLLGACRTHFNLEQGDNAAKHACELEPEDAGSYVLLSNIHAAAVKLG